MSFALIPHFRRFVRAPIARAPIVRAPFVRVAVMVATLVSATLTTACNREPRWQGTAISPARDVSAFSFKDSTNTSVAVAPTRGNATLVFFGYTNCPDVCATTLNDWVRVRKALGEQANHVRFVFITIDPARDTPAVAQRFVAQFDSSFVGVSGDSTQTAQIQRVFGVASAKIAPMPSHDYLMGHSAQTFIVNDRGQLVVMHTYAAGWDRIAADLKQLLH